MTFDGDDLDDVEGDWLGVPMFFSSYGPEKTKQLVEQAGFEPLEAAVEIQREQLSDVPFLWVLARKR